MHNTRGRVLFLSQGGGVKRDQSGDVPFQRRDRCSGIGGYCPGLERQLPLRPGQSDLRVEPANCDQRHVHRGAPSRYWWCGRHG